MQQFPMVHHPHATFQRRLAEASLIRTQDKWPAPQPRPQTHDQPLIAQLVLVTASVAACCAALLLGHGWIANVLRQVAACLDTLQ